jgi:hypothetical protein
MVGVGQEAGAAAPDAGALAQAGPGSYQPPETFHGRPVSWVAVSIIIAGFVIGGLGLVFGPTWWVFWVGAGAAVVGGLLAMGTHIFNDWY